MAVAMAYRDRRHPARREIYLRRDRVKPLLQVFLPMVAYVALVPWLGLYIASALFIAGFMWWHGGYRWRALPTGIAVCAAFYLLLEAWFQVELYKGPVLDWLVEASCAAEDRRWNRFDALLHGFAVALTPYHLLLMVVGVLLGILVGVLPGLGAPNGVTLLLPLTFTMQPVSAIILLSCMYWGALFGGSTTSILFNIPGEPSSVATTFDGYPMAQEGARRRSADGRVHRPRSSARCRACCSSPSCRAGSPTSRCASRRRSSSASTC